MAEKAVSLPEITLNCCLSSRAGIGNLWPAGHTWPTTTFLCGPPHDLGISQCEKGKYFLLLSTMNASVYTLSKHKGKQSQKNILIKQNFVDVGL